MNYGQLKTQLDDILHRTDLQPQYDTWMVEAQNRIEQRFHVDLMALVADTDSDEILSSAPLLYLYGMLREAAIWQRDHDRASDYSQLWNIEADYQAVSGIVKLLDPWTDANGNPPQIKRG